MENGDEKPDIAPSVLSIAARRSSIGIDRGWIRDDAIRMLWIFVYALIGVPILDYRRLKISKIIDTTDLRFLQKINYAYSCRFKYPKHFFMG